MQAAAYQHFFNVYDNKFYNIPIFARKLEIIPY